MFSRSAVVVIALAAAGCAVGTEAPDAVGYVLLDRDARVSGKLSQGSWEGAPVLPVALDVAAPVAFASNAGRSVFNIEPGMLTWVHGEGGALEQLRLNEDVSEDSLRVYGSREAAQALAQQLAAEVKGGSDGVFTVVAPDLLARGSFMNAPASVVEVAPALSFDVRPGASPFNKRAAITAAAEGL